MAVANGQALVRGAVATGDAQSAAAAAPDLKSGKHAEVGEAQSAAAAKGDTQGAAVGDGLTAWQEEVKRRTEQMQAAGPIGKATKGKNPSGKAKAKENSETEKATKQIKKRPAAALEADQPAGVGEAVGEAAESLPASAAAVGEVPKMEYTEEDAVTLIAASPAQLLVIIRDANEHFKDLDVDRPSLKVVSNKFRLECRWKETPKKIGFRKCGGTEYWKPLRSTDRVRFAVTLWLASAIAANLVVIGNATFCKHTYIPPI